jgi:hypothetical protein
MKVRVKSFSCLFLLTAVLQQTAAESLAGAAFGSNSEVIRASVPLPNKAKIFYMRDAVLAAEGTAANGDGAESDYLIYENRVWRNSICDIVYHFTGDRVSAIRLNFKSGNYEGFFELFKENGRMLTDEASLKLLTDALYYGRSAVTEREQAEITKQSEVFKTEHETYYPKTETASFVYDNQLVYLFPGRHDDVLFTILIYPHEWPQAGF